MDFPELTYEQWCKHSAYYLAEAYKYNQWRVRAKARLLSDIAPRVDRLDRQFYVGCGFHYSLEQELGQLIHKLALPVQWSANHCAKIPVQETAMIWNEVSVQSLIRNVVKAERSVIELAIAKGKI